MVKIEDMDSIEVQVKIMRLRFRNENIEVHKRKYLMGMDKNIEFVVDKHIYKSKNM